MTTSQIATSLNISPPTALRTMTELKALRLVDMTNGDSNTPAKITLDPKFSWVFDKQFLELRNGFVPSDNGEFLRKERKEKLPLTHDNLILSNQQHKEKISSITENNNDDSNKPCEPEKREIKFTPDYEAGKPIFSQVFEDLAKDNNGLVYYDKLQDRLVSTGQFFVGDAVLMIEYMEKIGEIEETEQYHVYRRKTAASPELKHNKNNDVVRGKFS
jgi:hypothetical protein